MKQGVVFLVLFSAVLWAGCDKSSSPAAPTSAAPAAKPVNLTAEIARAKADNKLLFLEFGSSDSCPPCILFQQKVFSRPEFLAYEKSNLDFVRLDYPQLTALPPAIQTNNVLLARQFDVSMFPTFVALDRDGNEFWRMPEKDNRRLKRACSSQKNSSP